MAALHIASIFLSAFLLFLVQPMIAKALLPDFGGSPAVWGTCLVVFQGLLLAGYASADRVRRLPPKTLVAVQMAIVLLPLALLPPALRTAPPGATAWPVPALVLALAASVAAPFFALSTNSTLVQSGYARTVGREPYFLYAASNVGSLLALAAYPFLLEPRMPLSSQRYAFAAGYVAFAALTLVLGVLSLRRGAQTQAPDAPVDAGEAPTWSQRRRWLWLAAVPSGLLVATTLHISTDVAAVPLLWVLPLALYLLSFVLAFLPRADGALGMFPRDRLVLVTRLLSAGSLAALHSGADLPYGFQLLLALGTLFVGAWLCHGEVAAARPSAGRLGEFYLWVSAGGLAGGIFGNLLAPFVFSGVAEYPIFVFALALTTVPVRAFRDRRRSAIFLSVVCAFIVLTPMLAARAVELPIELQLLPLVILPLSIAARRRPERFAVAAAAIAIYVAGDFGARSSVLDAKRSFFGVVRVIQQDDDFRVMTHGTTVHGHEFRKTPYPIGYYYPTAPIAVVVALEPEGSHIGVVGLGTGAIADLAKTGQKVDFYEIDPIVEPMARRWFRYLGRSKGEVQTILGDARLTLARADDESYDLLVMDAFTSDAIPIHLITRDAIELYLKKLKPGGRILVHVSNNYLDVVPVVRGAARELGLPGVHLFWTPSTDEVGWGASPSNVVVLARTPEALQPLVEKKWEALGDSPVVEWTDERSSLLEVLRDGTWF